MVPKPDRTALWTAVLSAPASTAARLAVFEAGDFVPPTGVAKDTATELGRLQCAAALLPPPPSCAAPKTCACARCAYAALAALAERRVRDATPDFRAALGLPDWVEGVGPLDRGFVATVTANRWPELNELRDLAGAHPVTRVYLPNGPAPMGPSGVVWRANALPGYAFAELTRVYPMHASAAFYSTSVPTHYGRTWAEPGVAFATEADAGQAAAAVLVSLGRAMAGYRVTALPALPVPLPGARPRVAVQDWAVQGLIYEEDAKVRAVLCGLTGPEGPEAGAVRKLRDQCRDLAEPLPAVADWTPQKARDKLAALFAPVEGTFDPYPKIEAHASTGDRGTFELRYLNGDTVLNVVTRTALYFHPMYNNLFTLRVGVHTGTGAVTIHLEAPGYANRVFPSVGAAVEAALEAVRVRRM